MKKTDMIIFRGRPVTVTTEWEEYNPALSNNGGSYYQPTITAKSRGYTLEITDTSCGDFGSRVDACLYRGSVPRKTWQDKRHPVMEAQYGEMYEEAFSSFCAGFWTALARKLGYNIPTLAAQ